MHTNDLIADDILVALRRITRTIDLHSRQLMQQFGLTVPQLLALHDLEQHEDSTASELSQRLNLSVATVAGIVGRLERRGFLERRRCLEDRRRLLISLTGDGHRVLAAAPSLLQQAFVEKLGRLADWEQHLLLSSLQRLVVLMEAEDVEAAPLLAAGAADAGLEPATSAVEVEHLLDASRPGISQTEVEASARPQKES